MQSKIRQLEKEAPPPPPPATGPAMSLSLPQPARSGQHVVVLDRVQLGYGGEPVYDGLDFRIDRGPDHEYFRLRPEHKGHSASSRGISGRYPTVFRYEPTDVAVATRIPDGDVDGNGVVDFVDFITLSIIRFDSALS